MNKKYIYIDELMVDAFDGCVVFTTGKCLNLPSLWRDDLIKCDLRHISGKKAIIEYGGGWHETIVTIKLSKLFIIKNDEKYYIKKRGIFKTLLNILKNN